MKKGLIIIFCDSEQQIEKIKLIELFRNVHNLQICLVNNESQDQTLELLYEIKEFVGDKISVVDIKKKFTTELANKAGLRYLTNEYNLKEVKYLNVAYKKYSPSKVSQIIKDTCDDIQIEMIMM